MPSTTVHSISRSFMMILFALFISASSRTVGAQDDRPRASLLHARQLMQIVEAGGKGYFASGTIMNGQATVTVPALTSVGAIVVPPNVSKLVVTASTGEVLATWLRISGKLQMGKDTFSPLEIYAKEQGKSVEIVLGLFLKDGGFIKCEGEDAPAKIAIRGIEFSKDPKSDVHGNWPMPEERKEWDTKLLNSTKPFEQKGNTGYGISSRKDSLYPGRLKWVNDKTSSPSLQLEMRLFEISGTSTIDFLTNTRIEIWCDGELTVDAPLMSLVSASADPAIPNASTLRCDTKVSEAVHPIIKDHDTTKDNTVFLFRWPIIHLRTKAVALEYNGNAKRVKYNWSEVDTDLPLELYKVKFRCRAHPFIGSEFGYQSTMVVGSFVDGRRTPYPKDQHYQFSLADGKDLCEFPVAPLQAVGRIFDKSSKAAYRGRWLYADPIFISRSQSISRRDLFDGKAIPGSRYSSDSSHDGPPPTLFMTYTYN